MTHHRLGHADEAKRIFEKCNSAVQEALAEGLDPDGPLSWQRSMTLRLLQAEAARTLASADINRQEPGTPENP